MGQWWSHSEINRIEKAANLGPVEVFEFIQDHKEKLKTDEVKCIVTGRSYTGKSTFINIVKDDFDKPVIAFFDLPEYEILRWQKSYDLIRNEIVNYDYIFIFFSDVISEDEYRLVEKLNDIGKPFSLVRSKVDQDVANAEYDGKKREDVITEIRKCSELPKLQNNKIYLISNRDKTMGDWSLLMTKIQRDVCKLKTTIYSLPRLSSRIIEQKHKKLKRRLQVIAVATSILAAGKTPGIAINIIILAATVIHFISVFGLNRSKLGTLNEFDQKQLRCKKSNVLGLGIGSYILFKFGILTSIVATETMIGYNLRGIGSAVSAGSSLVFVFKFLSNILNNLVDDAGKVYNYVSKYKYL